MRTKRRVRAHLIDHDAQKLLHASIPRGWVLRDYRPDYGIDYSMEVFVPSGDDPDSLETLGEHLFIQLKGVRAPERQMRRIKARSNVEKGSLVESAEIVGELEVIPFQLEIDELLTVQRMGPAVPVLLVIADLTSEKCFAVCLNDYIDKILVPQHDDYAAAGSRVVHVPVRNELSSPMGRDAMRWYAKRAKLYGAFQKFVFQQGELRASNEREELARFFARRLLEWDFWDDTEMWAVIGLYGTALKTFLATGSPGLMRTIDDGIHVASGGDANIENEIREQLRQDEIGVLWSNLALLPRNYEDVCREWFLPTALAMTSCY